MAKTKTGKRRRAKKHSNPFTRAASFLARFCILFVCLSILWTGLYAFLPVKETSLMGWRKMNGTEISRSWVPLDEISPHLVLAVIAAEDNKFCRHFGFDLGEIRAALKAAQNGEGLRGASTITQQTAKNAFLWPGRDIARKGFEAWFTVLVEVMWSKERVMEVYLNIAEWGDGQFGAEAAAQHLFNKPAKDLSAREASLMAAILPSPNKWRASPPGPYVSKRAKTIQARMLQIDKQGWASCAKEG